MGITVFRILKTIAETSQKKNYYHVILLSNAVQRQKTTTRCRYHNISNHLPRSRPVVSGSVYYYYYYCNIVYYRESFISRVIFYFHLSEKQK